MNELSIVDAQLLTSPEILLGQYTFVVLVNIIVKYSDLMYSPGNCNQMQYKHFKQAVNTQEFPDFFRRNTSTS